MLGLIFLGKMIFSSNVEYSAFNLLCKMWILKKNTSDGVNYVSFAVVLFMEKFPMFISNMIIGQELGAWFIAV